MKTKLLYVGLSIFILSALVFVGLTLKTSETDLSSLNGEVQLISQQIDEQDVATIDSIFTDLKSEIDIQKALIQENLETIETLKAYIEANEVELSRKDLIYIKLSMGEIKTYRRLFINTFDLMKDEFIAIEGQYDTLTEDEKSEVKQNITDIITYRLVLLEKVNLELTNIIDLVQVYEEEI
ncbi:hypothetical protein [Mariniplasma anaerobium]|uniref:Uncharacterized protein n=1 Tax=Mariniplasma anaerobium TaxID=2735436 RepID=A0A7U9TI81_9MOLU|nr:hypothetical protein [Mariniplasma anaerobium]BCR35430.1 hypothetical protein MPAN_003230 [Mariniplasma anaerobium]